MSTTAFAMTVGLTLLFSAVTAWGARVADPTPRPPAKPANGWNAGMYRYQRPAQMIVEESTPTEAQVDWRARPPALRPNEAAPAATAPATPRAVDNLNIVRLRFTDADGDVVPALLCTPKDQKGPFPLVVAVHGLTSNKAQVVAQVAPALAARGFAVLAADMPRHGERPGDPYTILDKYNPLRAFTMARQAINDVRQCIDLAEARSDLDTSNGVIMVGFSMGSWISSVVGPLEDRVKAMALIVGGAHDTPRLALMLPQIAAWEPRLALAHFAGRPLLMLNGKHDHVVVPEMAKRLYVAAPEPKEQRWYDAGHLLTKEAFEEAADWVAQKATAAKPRRAGNGENAKDMKRAG